MTVDALSAAATKPQTTWQRALQGAVRDVAELAALLDLPVEALDAAAGGAGFPLLVPRGFVARMRRRDPRDPLLLQVLPRTAELLSVPGYTADPVEEIGLSEGGVVKKYAGRALIIASGACPVHCRYCFRREYPYREQLAQRDGWRRAVGLLREMPDVDEVILSGGDPLTLANGHLARLLEALESLETLRRIRIHTRYPIMIPERVDDGLLRLFSGARLPIVLVTHSNHANELDASVADAAGALRRIGVTLLNQAVLLRGVNDDANALVELSERLFACGILPYYLHLLDRVAGAAHFDVDEQLAVKLHAELRERLPGYLVPRLVREIPGRASKTPAA